jgi:hypothetical protein
MNHPKTKLVGAFLLWGLLWFAVGNGHRTESAVQGANRWWTGQVHSQVKAHVELQKKIDSQ